MRQAGIFEEYTVEVKQMTFPEQCSLYLKNHLIFITDRKTSCERVSDKIAKIGVS